MPIQQMFLGLGASEKFAEATGGTVTTSGDYKIHAFTSSGTFTVTQLADTNEFEALIISGGASPGSTTHAGGGGGGGVANHQTGQALTAAAYTVTVGAGGSAPAFNAYGVYGNAGSDSSIKLASNNSIILEADVSDITSNDGRHEFQNDMITGGGSFKVVNGTTTQYAGGAGGYSGGAGSGQNGYAGSGDNGGNGGSGITTTITGSSVTLGGGGGAGSNASGGYTSTGGAGGGGNGAGHNSGQSSTAGAVNTGGGGGGCHSGFFNGANNNCSSGGSGIVYIKYKYQ